MNDPDPEDPVFQQVACLFGLLSTPIRLKIISAVCQGEKHVCALLGEIDTPQPNMSQHQATLRRCGVLARRREGTQVCYRLRNPRVAAECRSVCLQMATEPGQGGTTPVRAVAQRRGRTPRH